MKSKNKDMPEGFKCGGCGTFHKFDAYVWAHWNERLTHTCECGVVVDIVGGGISPHKQRQGFSVTKGPKRKAGTR